MCLRVITRDCRGLSVYFSSISDINSKQLHTLQLCCMPVQPGSLFYFQSQRAVDCVCLCACVHIRVFTCSASLPSSSLHKPFTLTSSLQTTTALWLNELCPFVACTTQEARHRQRDDDVPPCENTGRQKIICEILAQDQSRKAKESESRWVRGWESLVVQYMLSSESTSKIHQKF